MFTAKLALSTPTVDYTYEKIAAITAALAAYIEENGHIGKSSKVIVYHREKEEMLLLLLALQKLQANVILMDCDIAQMLLNTIVDIESPDLVITCGNTELQQLPYPLLKVCCHEVPVYEKERSVVAAEEIYKALQIGIYTANDPDKKCLDRAFLEKTMKTMQEGIAPAKGDKYLIVDSIPLDEFITEALWCLFNGIHLLCFPFEKKVISRLLPDREHFTMDFSLFFFGSTKDTPGQGPCYELLLNSVKHADRHNYTAVWTPERHFNEFGGKYPNPSVLSAAIAAVTNKIQIRTGSIVSPLHHVVRIAEDWAVIDNLSGGRTALSFASGWQCNDFIFYPERYATRHATLLEQINDFRKLWKGEKLLFVNGANEKAEIKIYPQPVQEEMPLWVTVSGKIETFIDAGKIGANILTHLLWQEPSELIEKIQAYRNSLMDHGYDPLSHTVSVMLHTYVGDNKEEVRKLVEKPLKEYIRSSLNLIEAMTNTVKATGGNNAIGRYSRNEEQLPDDLKEELLEFAFERFLVNTSLLGDLEHGSQVVKRLRSYGVDELACLIDFGLDNANILKGLTRLNRLKDRFHASSQKKYKGNIVLRVSQSTLLKLIETAPDEVEYCKKIVTGSAQKQYTGYLHKELLTLVYRFNQPNGVLIIKPAQIVNV